MSIFFRYESFKRQIILTFVVGSFLLITAFAAYLLKDERENLYRKSVEETIGLAKSLAVSSLSWVLANDVAGLREVVQSFRDYPALRYAMVISRSGRVLAHSDATKTGQFLSDERSRGLMRATPEKQVMIDDAVMFDVAIPVSINNRHVGWVRVCLGRENISGALRRMMLSSAVFVLWTTMLSLFAAVIIANRLGRRIGALMKVAEEVQAGNFATRVVNIPSGADEITKLANSLNQMLDALARNEERLRAASLYTRSLIEASQDPLVTISPEGKITDANRTTEEATGRSRAELIGTDFSDYFTEPEKAREGYQQVFLKGSVTDYPLALRHSDGHVTEVLYNASLYRDEFGAVRGVFAAARDITQQKQASQYARSLIEASLDPLVTISSEGKITDVNAATVKVTGAERKALIGTDFSDYFTEPDKAREGYRRVFAEGFVTDYPLTIRHRNGRLTDVLYNASIYRNEAGEVLGVFAAARDVTERNKAEQQLAQLNAQHTLILDSAGEGIYGLDADGRCTFANPAASQMLGFKVEELIGRHGHALFHHTKPDGLPYPEEECPVQAAHQRGKVHRGSDLYWRKDGSSFPVEFISTPIFEAGKISGAVVVFSDITERRQAENALREKEERLALATVNNGVGIWDWNLQTQEMIWDDSMYALYHIRREDFAGTEEAWRAALHPDDLARGDKEVEDAIAGKKPFETEFRVLWPNGEIRYIKAVAKVFRDDQGTPLRMLGINMDVSDRNKAEMELRELNNDFVTLLENTSDFIYFKDRSSRIRFCSQTLANITGHHSWRDMIGKNDLEVFPADVARIYHEEELPVFQEGKPLLNKTDPYYDEQGRPGWVNTNKWPVFGDDKKTVVGIFGISRDITELKQAEDKITELNRSLERRVIERTGQLEAANKELEAFAYSVSHDLRAPLRAIDGFSHILLEDYTDKLDDEGKRLLNVVRDNTSRMGQLIDDILKFSRAGRLEINFSEIDMESMASEVYQELRPTAAPGLQVEIGHIPAALGDRAMMRQVLVNLLSNAIKFTRASENPRIEVGSYAGENETVYFVKDNGAGFEMQYVDRLFGVFQRLHTESEFEGTGIGLAIIKRIITRHGGRVWAEGKVNEGATIYFALPAKEQGNE